MGDDIRLVFLRTITLQTTTGDTLILILLYTEKTTVLPFLGSVSYLIRETSSLSALNYLFIRKRVLLQLQVVSNSIKYSGSLIKTA